MTQRGASTWGATGTQRGASTGGQWDPEGDQHPGGQCNTEGGQHAGASGTQSGGSIRGASGTRSSVQEEAQLGRSPAEPLSSSTFSPRYRHPLRDSASSLCPEASTPLHPQTPPGKLRLGNRWTPASGSCPLPPSPPHLGPKLCRSLRRSARPGPGRLPATPRTSPHTLDSCPSHLLFPPSRMFFPVDPMAASPALLWILLQRPFPERPCWAPPPTAQLPHPASPCTCPRTPAHSAPAPAPASPCTCPCTLAHPAPAPAPRLTLHRPLHPPHPAPAPAPHLTLHLPPHLGSPCTCPCTSCPTVPCLPLHRVGRFGKTSGNHAKRSAKLPMASGPFRFPRGLLPSPCCGDGSSEAATGPTVGSEPARASVRDTCTLARSSVNAHGHTASSPPQPKAPTSVGQRVHCSESWTFAHVASCETPFSPDPGQELPRTSTASTCSLPRA
nr:leucine-rich repeat extensin-like protein 5 [Vulpes vulpes]